MTSVDLERVVGPEAALIDRVLVIRDALVKARVFLTGRVDLHLRLDDVAPGLVLDHLFQLQISVEPTGQGEKSSEYLEVGMREQLNAVLEPRDVRTRLALCLAVERQFAAEDVLRLEVRRVDHFGPLRARNRR